MDEPQVLEKVKRALGITGTYQDETLKMYIEEVKEYMTDAGVDTNVVNGASSVGTIARGVADLWNYGAGNAKLSQYFIQRVIQLSYKGKEENNE